MSGVQPRFGRSRKRGNDFDLQVGMLLVTELCGYRARVKASTWQVLSVALCGLASSEAIAATCACYACKPTLELSTGNESRTRI